MEEAEQLKWMGGWVDCSGESVGCLECGAYGMFGGCTSYVASKSTLGYLIQLTC
jgi:hypothetical protein